MGRKWIGKTVCPGNWQSNGTGTLYTDASISDIDYALGLYGNLRTLLRKSNGRLLSPAVFAAAISLLRSDVFLQRHFQLLTVADADILSSITYIQKHNLNSTDAALLASLLRYAQTTGETCVLVAADSRLCRAALAEGLAVINPETMPAADVPAFLNAL